MSTSDRFNSIYVYIRLLCLQSPEIRKYRRKFSGEILCGALWGVNLFIGTDNGLLLLDRSGHGKGGLYLESSWLC